MHTDLDHALALEFAGQVNHLYAALLSVAPAAMHREQEPSLGGKLLYAGELEPHSRALVVAANIAGAASLAATADLSAQKQAIRDGVLDFLVTSLDEALRILKNQIRKRETVAVCVAAAPEAVEREMLERGVLPDLVSPAASQGSNGDAFLKQGARRVEMSAANDGGVLVAWQVDAAPARWLPQIDAIALDCIDAEDMVSRRWMRLAPRYLGRLVQGMHVATFTPEMQQAFISRVEEGRNTGTIGVEVKIKTVG